MDVKYNAYIAKLNSEISPAFAERINEWAENNEFDDFDSLCAEIKEDEPLIFEALEIPLYHRMWMMRLLIDERAFANDGEEKQQRTVQSFDTMRDHEEVKETNQHSHDHNDKFHINNDAFERFTLEMDLEINQIFRYSKRVFGRCVSTT
eukprot:107828_1